MSESWTQVSVKVLGLTKKAVRVIREIGGHEDDPEWVPLSQVRDPNVLEVGLEDVIEIATWLAEDRGWT